MKKSRLSHILLWCISVLTDVFIDDLQRAKQSEQPEPIIIKYASEPNLHATTLI